ncbi:hypothetical protein EGW08_008783 [Elysia chlorotica]|uniref:WSC domain-containing protein n=1 Tax=Elysia chlorotica TaxID=188477 RepID=A0A3S1BGJ9_ELYCH|nr:hypothetical protein EGW08_008783 [Elysia chlorotica]
MKSPVRVLVIFSTFLLTAHGYLIKTLGERCYWLAENPSQFTFCSQGDGLAEFESQHAAVDTMRSLVLEGRALKDTLYRVSTQRGIPTYTTNGFTDHYWLDGTPVDIWGTGDAGLANCIALYVTESGAPPSDLDVRATVYPCGQVERFACQGPVNSSCADLLFEAFTVSDKLYYRSTVLALSVTYDPCASELSPAVSTAWFDGIAEMVEVAHVLDAISTTSYHLDPLYDAHGNPVWNGGSAVEAAAYQNGPPVTPHPCLRFERGLWTHLLTEGNCSSSPAYILCRASVAQVSCPTPPTIDNANYTIEIVQNPATNTSAQQITWYCLETDCMQDAGSASASGITQLCQASGNWSGQPIDCTYVSDPECPVMENCHSSMVCVDYIRTGGTSHSCGASRHMTCLSGSSFSFGQELAMDCVGGVWEYSNKIYSSPRCSQSTYYVGCVELNTDFYRLNLAADLYQWNATKSALERENIVYPESTGVGLTPSLCRDFCLSQAMYWAVLHEGDKCGCHPYDFEMDLVLTANNSLCSAPCLGEPTFFCGGNTVGSAYVAIGGCYQGDFYATITLSDEDMVQALCVQHCLKANMPFSVVRKTECYCLEFQDTVALTRVTTRQCRAKANMPFSVVRKTECYCLEFQDTVALTRVTTRQCRAVCPGRESNFCGGEEAGVYTVMVNALQTLPETCVEVFDSGVRAHGEYLLSSGLTSCFLSGGHIIFTDTDPTRREQNPLIKITGIRIEARTSGIKAHLDHSVQRRTSNQQVPGDITPPGWVGIKARLA